MNKLSKKLAQLFKTKRKVDYNSIIHDQFDWKSVSSKSDQLQIKQDLYQEFIDWLPNKINRNPSILFFDNDKSRGYALMGDVLMDMRDQIFGLIRNHIEVLVDSGYKVKISEVSSHQTTLGMVAKYRIYLKPSLRFRLTPKSLQLYGNIGIEYKLEDDTPTYFRVLSHTYNDQHFEPALSMDMLMQLFTQTSNS